jgi:hypothetical protein
MNCVEDTVACVSECQGRVQLAGARMCAMAHRRADGATQVPFTPAKPQLPLTIFELCVTEISNFNTRKYPQHPRTLTQSKRLTSPNLGE